MNNRGIFCQCILHPLRNPRQCKNKPFIGLQLVVMWFIPLVRCPRGINHVTPRFRPITLTYLLILILLREHLGINLPIEPQKINHASKGVVRIMSRIAFDAHTDLYNLKILNLESIYKFQIGKFMYQYGFGLLPYSFNNMFLATHQVDSYGTTSSELFYLSQCRTNIRKFSISITRVVF